MSNNSSTILFLDMVCNQNIEQLKKYIKDYPKKYEIDYSINIKEILDKIIKFDELIRFEILLKFTDINLKKYSNYLFPLASNNLKILKWLFLNKFYEESSIESAFYFSCKNSNLETMSWLINLNIKINFSRNNDELFRYCCDNDLIDSLMILCKHNKFNLKIDESYHDEFEDEEPFHFFCRHNYYKIAKVYLENFAFDINSKNDEAICLSCQEGNLEMAQLCYLLGGDIQNKNNWCLRMAIMKDNLNIVLWIFSLKIIDFHYNNDEILKYCCFENKLNLVKWICSFDNFNLENLDEEFFFNLCLTSNLEIIKFIFALKHFDINLENDLIFRYVCQLGNIDILKWIYSLGNVDLHFEDDLAFRIACNHNHLEIAQWIYSLGDVRIKSNRHEAFISSCINNNLEITRWLIELNSDQYKIILENNRIKSYQIIKLVYIQGIKFLTSDKISECCVCYEEPNILTSCNHFYCKECFLNYINSKDLEIEETPCAYCRTTNFTIFEVKKID